MNSNALEKTVMGCTLCLSEKVHKDGTRKTQAGLKQRWLCSSCNQRFVVDPFPRLKGTLTAVVLTMDLAMKGLSYRAIADSVRQFFNLKISHVTVMRWVKRGMGLLTNYVADLHPKAGERWMADEQVIKIQKKLHYIWNSMDSKTRFLLATQVTKTRNIDDARSLFKKAKKTADSIAKIVVTDSYPGYEKAVKKEFYSYQNKKPHRKYGLKKRYGANHKIERYHGTFRQREKVTRRFKKKETAQEFIINYQTFYNFIREHESLGMTPAQAAGINVPSKWADLITQSLKETPSKKHPSVNSRR